MNLSGEQAADAYKDTETKKKTQKALKTVKYAESTVSFGEPWTTFLGVQICVLDTELMFLIAY